ncbi:MAG: hypothetical protein P8Y53_14910 [Pseudolabrys sp.]|jgi:hypothetical protein
MIPDMFVDYEAQVQEATIDEIVGEQKALASKRLMAVLINHPQIEFSKVFTDLLQPFVLRETNVKDTCVELAKAGEIENTWGGRGRKPRDGDVIRLKST